MTCSSRATLVVLLLFAFQSATSVRSADPIRYRFTFPEPEHHWMQVEVSFTELDPAPLELRMSRASPGRYSLHDFAKNVYDVHAFGPDDHELATTRPDAYGWTIASHGDSLRVTYKVFGDRLDGTYLAVDTTHAHINEPAAIMWARGLDDRSVTMTFAEPPGQNWQVATQLHAASTPLEFTAPNLQYLMDSPVEFSPVAIRQFTVGEGRFHFAAHYLGTEAELDAFVKDVEKIVREEGAIYGEYPLYEPGSYTFLADYLPDAAGDGMEHRNSTVMTSSGSVGRDRASLLDTVAHEFFHSWNVERIRPQSLEPFDFERANLSGELWLAEGFTQYYGPLVLSRAGLASLPVTAVALGGLVTSVALNPAHLVRSAEEMSRMAPFTDGARPLDRTNWSNTVISYYSFGGAIALALDLTLRDRTEGRVTLDDYMKAMWRVHGRPGGSREGYVDRPYTMMDAEARLAEVSDPAFAREFFSRYIQGHDVADYSKLLMRAGLVLRKQNPGRAWWGNIRFEFRDGGVHIATPPAFDTPIYLSGLDVGDELKQIDDTRITSIDGVTAALERHKPGDRLAIVFSDRGRAVKSVIVTLVEDPRLELVPVESIGVSLTAGEKTFRDRWLGSKR
jgi:predicted metalloprotease with PDZ domain